METPVINTRAKMFGLLVVTFSWIAGCDKVTVKYFRDGVELHDNNFKYYESYINTMVNDFFLANPKLIKWSY